MRSTPRSARRISILFSCALSAVLATALFLTLNASASTVQPRAQDAGSTPLPPAAPGATATPAPDGLRPTGAPLPAGLVTVTEVYTASAINPTAGTQGTASDRIRTTWVGVVVSAPRTMKGDDPYVGKWEILVSPFVTKTLIVTGRSDPMGGTRVQNLPNPPKIGDRVEARGYELTKDMMLVERFRPNGFVAGEVAAQLVSRNVLTDVTTQYGLKVIDDRMAGSNIYLFQTISADVDEQNLARQLISDTQKVRWAGVNAMISIPSNPTLGDPYRTWKWGGLDPIGFANQYAWGEINFSSVGPSIRGAGITVAVLDTGVDAAHPDFQGHLLMQLGRDLVNDDFDPQDGPEVGEAPGVAQGHGTHVIGIILRVAPDAMILPIRVLDQNGVGDTFSLAYAIELAANSGAKVINLSLGADADQESMQLLGRAVQSAIDKGVIVVAAAGNDDHEQPQYPAAFPRVISVTAVDDIKVKAPFANFGTGWVLMAAPGVGITSTVPLSSGVLYAAWSGTSMATPFVSGAAALVAQKFPDLTPEGVRNRLFLTGIDLNPYNPKYPDQLGHLLDLGAALSDLVIAPPTPTPVVTPPPAPSPTPTVPAPQPTPDPTQQPMPEAKPERVFLPALIKGEYVPNAGGLGQ